jgi:hypothetical protein
MPLLSAGVWGDIAIVRGLGSVVFPFLNGRLRICVVELFLLLLCVEVCLNGNGCLCWLQNPGFQQTYHIILIH